jgi:transcriptional regulator with XRE-family HTH domain
MPMLNVNRVLISSADRCTYKIIGMKYGDRLRLARKHAGLSQSQLAEEAGVSQSTVSQLENSETDIGSLHTVRFARACKVSPDWLDDEIGDMEPLVYQTTDPKIIAVAKLMEPLPEYGKDAAAKDVAEVAQLIARAQSNNGTDG